jgi:hypothetical protein
MNLGHRTESSYHHKRPSQLVHRPVRAWIHAGGEVEHNCKLMRHLTTRELAAMLEYHSPWPVTWSTEIL